MPRALVETLYTAEFAKLARNARIKTYIPVLIHRHVKALLLDKPAQQYVLARQWPLPIAYEQVPLYRIVLHAVINKLKVNKNSLPPPAHSFFVAQSARHADYLDKRR